MGKVNPANFNADDLRTTQWVGIVEDTADDIFEGRCKIRVYGKMDDRVDPEDPESAYKLPTAVLPWARPHQLMYGGSATGSGKFEIPKLGSVVRLTFDNGNFYQPIYHENIYPSDETKAEIEASYSVEIINANGDSIVMLNDGNITFTHSAQFTINSGADTVINADTNTLINCVDAVISATGETHINSPRIKLGESAAEAVIKGDTFASIFNSHIHPAPGGPTGPPIQKADPSLSSKNTTD